jgi:hypothetical protein
MIRTNSLNIQGIADGNQPEGLVNNSPERILSLNLDLVVRPV